MPFLRLIILYGVEKKTEVLKIKVLRKMSNQIMEKTT